MSNSNLENSDFLDSVGRRNKRLLEKGDYSDFMIECGGRHFKVHRSIVCPQSTFLENLCCSNFKEGMEGRASLKETDPAVFEKALEFLYTGTYDSAATLTPTTSTIPTDQGSDLSTGTIQQDINSILETTASTEPISPLKSEDRLGDLRICGRHPLLLNVRLYHLAEFLQVESLKEEALERCTELLEENFDAESFIPAIKEALSQPNVRNFELGAQIIKSCVNNVRLVISHTTLEDLLMEYEPIAWTVLQEQRERYQEDQEDKTLEVSGLKERVSSLESCNKAHQRDEKALEEKINVIKKLLNEHRSCRNCDHDFGAYFEVKYNGLQLRCSGCQCRHGDVF